MTAQCDGKKTSWPELLHKDWFTAVNTIASENSLVSAVVVPENSVVTDDFICARVRVWVDKEGKVTMVPKVG
ncbi:hypothetical protein MLD38_036215 [Melastoma candidum]|uniref:Uncharacterized protein n=1 Tax=Melastoma candidum TaxID=119954 RepID=A0ACB9LJK4_9MYRT|nr:hypothetical protein MLD38_036215 [Melastoma candidum]